MEHPLYFENKCFQKNDQKISQCSRKEMILKSHDISVLLNSRIDFSCILNDFTGILLSVIIQDFQSTVQDDESEVFL